jgi:PTS system mannose-specific IIB component
MGIVHVRIDDRLIHGQVAAYWCNALKISRIMIANDKIANDDLRKSMLRMAAPPGIRTSLISLEKAANNINEGKYEDQRVLLIFEEPKDAVDLINLGVKIDTINVGNLAHKEGAIQIKSNIKVVKDEIEAFKKLHEMGVKLTARMVPDDPESDFMNYLNKVLD